MQERKPPPSSWHSKVRLAGRLMLSEPVKLKEAELLLVEDPLAGPAVIVVSGAVVSTAQL